MNVRGSGRMIFSPLGPRIARYSGRGRYGRRECDHYSGGGGYSRREYWEIRNRLREEKGQRELLQKLVKTFDSQLGKSAENRDMVLLRELEQRLRAKAGCQDSARDVDELMKTLEERLQVEKQSDGDEKEATGEYFHSLKAFLKRWDQRMEKRERLQKQWDDANATHQPLAELQDEVYTPEEFEKAKIEAKRKRLEEERKKSDVAEQAETIEASSSILKEHEDEVYTPEGEQQKPQLEKTVGEQTEKIEDLPSNLMERQDQVYTPKELRKAEEEEIKRTLLEEDEPKKATSAVQAESKNVEDAPSDGTVVHLKNEANGAELYLVGVGHISQESAAEVRDVIREVQPNYVMVELDRTRYNSLVQRRSGRYDPLNAFVQGMVKTVANDNVGMVGKVLDVVISGFYQVLALHGLRPGQELKVAIEEGKKVGAKIVLGDQDDDITMQRFGESLSMFDLVQFLLQPMPDDLKHKLSDASSRAPPAGSNRGQMFQMSGVELRDRKLSRRLDEEMATRAPAFYRILVTERNEVMTKALRNLSGTVVSVVGLGHLDGIEQLWREADAKYLNETE